MKIFLPIMISLAVFAPQCAKAMFQCEGNLNKENFVDERKAAQKELQNNIIEFRKLEGAGNDTPEAKAEKEKAMAKVEKSKKTFKLLDSKYFPTTEVTAFGAACNDRRWLETAKAKLVEMPDKLGRHWYVWLDKKSREPKVAEKTPSFDLVAE